MTEERPKADEKNLERQKELSARGSDEAQEAVAALRRSLKRTTLAGLNWKELRDEGRK